MQTEALVPPKSFYQGQKERLACDGLPATEKTSLCCNIHGFPGPFLKPRNHLEHISLEFYNILTQFPHPFHHRLPVRAKDSHEQILWSVSQKGSLCKVLPQSLLFLSRRTPFPRMNCTVTKQPWESWNGTLEEQMASIWEISPRSGWVDMNPDCRVVWQGGFLLGIIELNLFLMTKVISSLCYGEHVLNRGLV